MRHSDLGLYLNLTFLLLFLPQFLLALFTTVNLRDRSSLKILYRHPSLIILPTITFFSFSRLNNVNICCCDGDTRVSFSKRFTYINMTVTTVGFVSWFLYFGVNFAILIFTLLLLLFSILLTALFLHLDKLPKCCNPREQLSVYDPDRDQRFIIVNDKIVEDPEDDMEKSNNYM